MVFNASHGYMDRAMDFSVRDMIMDFRVKKIRIGKEISGLGIQTMDFRDNGIGIRIAF